MYIINLKLKLTYGIDMFYLLLFWNIIKIFYFYYYYLRRRLV